MDSKTGKTSSRSDGRTYVCAGPEETFALGEKFGSELRGGEVVLLSGPLGAGKTLFTKGVLCALNFDEAEVTSPSFTLVNEYDADVTVYHIDLWRIDDPSNAAASIGLDDLVEDVSSVKIIEWAERLGKYPFPRGAISIDIIGDGDSPREIHIRDVRQW